MSVNRILRVVLLVVAVLAGGLFFAFDHTAKFDGTRLTRHTRVGMASSPWLTIDSEVVTGPTRTVSSRSTDVALRSWSWVGLGVCVAAAWVRRRFTSAAPAGPPAVTPRGGP